MVGRPLWRALSRGETGRHKGGPYNNHRAVSNFAS
jgi:hypothetical protein